MKLNHLNLCVPDVIEARAFFEKFFGFRCLDTKGGDRIAVLEGEGGFTLVLTNIDRGAPQEYPADFHFGFILDDPECVHRVYQQLREGGVEPGHEPRAMRGSLIFYCRILGGILLEVSAPLPDRSL